MLWHSLSHQVVDYGRLLWWLLVGDSLDGSLGKQVVVQKLESSFNPVGDILFFGFPVKVVSSQVGVSVPSVAFSCRSACSNQVVDDVGVSAGEGVGVQWSLAQLRISVDDSLTVVIDEHEQPAHDIVGECPIQFRSYSVLGSEWIVGPVLSDCAVQVPHGECDHGVLCSVIHRPIDVLGRIVDGKQCVDEDEVVANDR